MNLPTMPGQAARGKKGASVVSVKEKHENRSGEDQRDERMRTDRSWMKGECHISHCESVRVKSLASLESSSLQIDMLMMMTGGHLWNACTQHYN